MPGGGGGGIAGMLMHGIGGGGMGGPGGGGMGGPGGMSDPSGQTRQEPITDEYDIDRWKRADGLDAPTLVQQVREDWNQKEAAKKKFKSPIKRVSEKRKHKKEEAEATLPPVNNTEIMPDMKRDRAKSAAAEIKSPLPPGVSAPPPPAAAAAAAASSRDGCRMCNPNYLGLTFEAGIDDFFKADPLNSAILAVDSLSLSALTLSQVTPPVENTHRCQRVLHQLERREAAQADGKAPPAGAEKSYMDRYREEQEQKKYKPHYV